MRLLSGTFAAMAILFAPQFAGADAAVRVVSIGSDVTEIVYALGQQDRLIARDTTSIWPPEAENLPDVGYLRALSPEGVLSVGPDLLLASDDSGPPDTLAVLQEAKVPLAMIPTEPSADGIVAKIKAVGAALAVEDKAAVLADTVRAQLKETGARAASIDDADRQRVLFILSTEGGRIMAAGHDSAAASVIEMAGGVNVFDSFDGYKQVSDEAILQAAPDAILMMTSGGPAMVDDDVLLTMPAIAATPAGKDSRIIHMSGQYLLGFGPRTAQAVQDLADALYGDGQDDDTGGL